MLDCNLRFKSLRHDKERSHFSKAGQEHPFKIYNSYKFKRDKFVTLFERKPLMFQEDLNNLKKNPRQGKITSL